MRAEELPVIQLPDYVISGIEKATAVIGERLATSATMGAKLPEESGSARPRFALDATASPVETPGVLAPLGRGYLKGSLLIGMRSWGGADVSLAGQTLPVAYTAGVKWDSPPKRTFADPLNLGGTGTIGVKSDFIMTGGYARDASAQTILETDIRLDNLHFGRFTRPSGVAERRISSLSLNAHTTTIPIKEGTLSGRFEYAYTSTEGDAKVSSSLDQLTLIYSKMIGTDRWESTAEFTNELVGEDTRGHSLLLLRNQMYRRLRDDLSMMVGLNVYVGSAKVTSQPWSGSPTSSSALRETSGLRPLVALAWTPSFGGVARIAYQPEVTFVRHQDITLQCPMLDTSSRGSTIEGVYRFFLGYQTRLTDIARIGLEVEARADRYKPYLVPGVADVWSIASRRSEATAATLRGDFDLPHSIGMGSFLRLTGERTVDGGVTGEAPFVPPVEVGADFTMPIREKLTFAQELSVKGKAPADFNGTLHAGNSMVWNASLRWRARPDLTADFGIHNLLNQPDQSALGYEADHFALWAKVEWHGNSPFSH